MELDEKEFEDMCRDMSKSMTSILITDDLTTLESNVFDDLYEFVMLKPMRNVNFQLTFECSPAHDQIEEQAQLREKIQNVISRMLVEDLKSTKFKLFTAGERSLNSNEINQIPRTVKVINIVRGESEATSAQMGETEEGLKQVVANENHYH